jgi:hypothetical protein
VVRKCSREVFFILMTIGYVISQRIQSWQLIMPRSALFQIGFFFPVFYLQLDSAKHDIDTNFSFYSVRLRLFSLLSILNSP